MSGPKKWKVHRKSPSKSVLSSAHSSTSPPEDSSSNRPPPSPPSRLPAEDATAATTIVDFGSGSTLATQKSNGPVGSYSSTDTSSTLTPSPSTTPPKKTWEKNYRSFLKSVKQSKASAFVPGARAPIQHTVVPSKPLQHMPSKPARPSFENATNLLPRVQPHQSLQPQKNENFVPSLADGFGDHSQHKPDPSTFTTSAGHHSTFDHKVSLTAPSSPSKHKEPSRGGAFFKRRLRSKTKSVDSLDSSMRKGVDRKSPTNTPTGSASSTPLYMRSPPASSPSVTALQEGMEKAALLGDLLLPPTLTSSTSLASHHRHSKPVSSQVDRKDGNLDEARHRGGSLSMTPSTMTLQTLASTSAIPLLFTRVQSMGSDLIIPEGEPVINHNKEQNLERERRKAFTDFHNNGIDSSSAYLGDESSLHKHSVLLSSMAYPAGSAGGKVHTKRTFSQSGAHSMDQKGADMTSISMNGAPEKNAQQIKSSDDEISPGRALMLLNGPEHWKKGERHTIIPGVLCMCPIQVLNNVMSGDEVPSNGPNGLSQTSRASQLGSGIGSIISEDEGVDSNGWFFADHHQPSTAGGTMPQHGSITSSNVQTSAFGKIILGKATVAPLGMRSFLSEVYGWCTGVFVLRSNFLFEYREGDSLNGLPWGYAHLTLAEAYPHHHFTNALHLDFFEKPCCKSGKRSLLLRVERKGERDRWVSLLRSAARTTMHDLYDVDESDGAEFGRGRYAVVRPAKRKVISVENARYLHATNSQDSFRNVSSYESLGGCNKYSHTDLEKGMGVEYNCALKIIDKKQFWSSVRKGRERVDTLVREAAVQTTLAVKGGDVPGFLQLRNIFETSEKLVLELELVKGANLFQHVSSHGVLDELEAANIMRDLLNCLNVLDRVGIAHRDIKPANILMCHDENANGTKIKLADYGMASFVGVDNLVRGRCGTPGFVAPEILLTGVNGGYGNKVDMFSAGVTLYVMLSGYEPFYGKSDAELIDANREAKVDFPHADWHLVSIEGRDLIEKMLVVDPVKRIGPREALRHPWITRRATLSQKNVFTLPANGFRHCSPRI